MRIRNLKWREVTMWPPEWTISEQETGEEGVLEYVQLRNDPTPRLISVEANHLGDIRKGIIVVVPCPMNNSQKCSNCDKLLQNHPEGGGSGVMTRAPRGQTAKKEGVTS